MEDKNLNTTDSQEKKKKKSFFQEVLALVTGVLNNFMNWLKPNPEDHWTIQVLKSIAKVPVVLLLILCSPILIAVLLLVFLLAL